MLVQSSAGDEKDDGSASQLTRRGRDLGPLELGFGIALAVALHVLVFPVETADVRDYLIPWLRHTDQVGLDYLRQPFTDYAPFYEHLYALLSLFPGDAVIRAKIFYICFEVAGAFLVTLVVPRDSRRRAFVAALLLPTVIHNAAATGQSDAIYTVFLLLSLLASMRRRPVFAMLAFSVALSIKFQSLLYLPFLALLFFRKRQPWWTFSLLPAGYVLFSIPMFLASRPIQDLINVYTNQAAKNGGLSSNAPNFWLLGNALPDTQIALLIGLPAAALTVLACVIWMSRKRLVDSKEGMLLAATTLMFLSTWIAPKMLDHFFYPAQILLLCLCFYNGRYLVVLGLAQLASLLSYVPFIMVSYDRFNPFFGETGYMQSHFGFGWGIFALAGAVPMTMVVVILLRWCANYRGEGEPQLS
ncbi:glycosyltransferase 87 family protein [Sphingomonas humi]|uniref:DUF2029 domain-containing protein n=1 Tax=Sphingomonas humi TaxID=335630 RepID=A0ABP7S9S5_9SPHN